jgi:hypothetical protein
MLGSRWRDVRFKVERSQVQGGEKPGSRWRDARFKIVGHWVWRDARFEMG